MLTICRVARNAQFDEPKIPLIVLSSSAGVETDKLSMAIGSFAAWSIDKAKFSSSLRVGSGMNSGKSIGSHEAVHD